VNSRILVSQSKYIGSHQISDFSFTEPIFKGGHALAVATPNEEKCAMLWQWQLLDLILEVCLGGSRRTEVPWCGRGDFGRKPSVRRQRQRYMWVSSPSWGRRCGHPRYITPGENPWPSFVSAMAVLLNHHPLEASMWSSGTFRSCHADINR
jgi:hypothetical protein